MLLEKIVRGDYGDISNGNFIAVRNNEHAYISRDTRQHRTKY